MLKAIAALGEPAPQPVAEPTPPRGDAAERRQLTVMFCDLVGSTALATRFDPEDLRDLIGAATTPSPIRSAASTALSPNMWANGVLIYFGYPQAHENDAERAVRAGLAVIEAVGRLPAREDLRVGLGIATGLAVVSDLIGEGAVQERGVVGEPPNLAARLQALAGFAEPQQVWRVIGSSASNSISRLRCGLRVRSAAELGNDRSSASNSVSSSPRAPGASNCRSLPSFCSTVSHASLIARLDPAVAIAGF
jgi:class 3 adenylate cyclase